MHIPDEVLLRRFGIVRAVGGAAYIAAVAVLAGIFGREAWPLALGVPVLLLVTTAYFLKSPASPRASVAVSLVADALVLGGAVAFLGGTGAGLVLLYAIVVVSAGILLGPAAATAFTAFTVFLGLLQLALEQLGVTPVLLHRPDVGERLPILLVSLAGLISVGYLSASYAGRLQELIMEAGEQAEVVRRKGRRRRSFAQQAAIDVREPLARLEDVAELLEERWETLPELERRRLAGRLRFAVTQLDADVGQLADVSTLDETTSERPQPVHLRRVVEDCIVGLGERLQAYPVDFDVPPLKVVGHRHAARRVVFNLLENVVEHTPAGTQIRIRAATTGGHAVLAITDNGPGIPADVVARLFDPAEGSGRRRVGLPLVRELCEAMGAEVRYEPAREAGARFLVAFRLAPRSAPTADDTLAVEEQASSSS
jgi:two-component system OmpR family sensor kinase